MTLKDLEKAKMQAAEKLAILQEALEQDAHIRAKS